MTALFRLVPEEHPWLKNPDLGKIFSAIRAGGGEARVVGGAVRDALLSRALGDFDLAVNLPPERVMQALNAQGIRVVPTGLAHGTVTAVLAHRGFEITTLRHDVETDGRHARVAFTDDWQADAARRDFTLNALYVEENGTLYDYFEGYNDLQKGRVRFIGDARARIQEDVLRILRFFRFTAWFAREKADPEGLEACRDLVALLPQLSAERVWREVTKLLLAPDPVPVWELMKETGVLAYVNAEATNTQRLRSLLKIENRYHEPPSALLRLSALLPQEPLPAVSFAERMKISRRDTEKLSLQASLPSQLDGHLDRIPLRSLLYRFGTQGVRAATLLLAAQKESLDITEALKVIDIWENPSFPLQGADLLKEGLEPGPALGVILKKVEAWWIEKDFQPTHKECLREAHPFFPDKIKS